MSANILQDKSYAFALRIANMSEYLNNEKREYVLSRKVLDSGTSIGALLEEGRQSPEQGEFRSKYSVANKEAFKTNYWVRLLRDSKFY